MGYWNHRVVRSVEKDGYPCWRIAEVHYNDDGQPFGWSDADVIVYASDEAGDPVEALRKQVTWYEEALLQPVLDVAEIERGTPPWKK